MGNEVEGLNPKSKRLLHVISYTSSYLVVFGFFWTVQIYTIGLIPWIQEIKIFDFPLYFIISAAISFLIVKKYFRFSTPYH